MKTAAYIISFLTLILNASFFIKLKPPYSFMVWVIQIFVAALAPFLVILGVFSATLGWLSAAPIAFVAGILAGGISIIYIILVSNRKIGSAAAFGSDFKQKILPEQKARLLSYRWHLGLPKVGEPRFEQNISFWTIKGTKRQLLCDIWQPPEGVKHSGLGVIYLHGSAWYLSDKDFGTRPLFRQLANQGHVIMDVAYRLIPEVDLFGMVGDAKRAVAWLKENTKKYGLSPDGIILSGGSAGGHLALLAAYTPHLAKLNPPELQAYDLSVKAVFSVYGPSDMKACYDHMQMDRTRGLPKIIIGQPGAATMKKGFTDAGRLDSLLGGFPDEVPETYTLGSPVTHVNRKSPPTLLIQGALDVITPVAATCSLRDRLAANGVPVVNIIYPLTNHAFDLILPDVNIPAQSAIAHIERFLALMA